MFTDSEKQIAKRIVEDEAIKSLIAKVFLDTEDKITEEHITSKTNNELGEIVRANFIAEQKVKLRWQRLQALATSLGTKKPKVVPR